MKLSTLLPLCWFLLLLIAAGLATWAVCLLP